VDKRLQSETYGCGIGLTFAQHVVAKHNGSISVDSRLGEGSKFTVVLPLQ
jgi:signal transduction histidine kinase